MTSTEDRRGASTGLVVLGMHRSGTSAVSGVLNACGAWVGTSDQMTRANEQNPKGFFELRDLRSICDSLLFSCDADWWRLSGFDARKVPPEAVAEQGARFADLVTEVSQHGVWSIKEPRLCVLYPLLEGYANAPVFALPVRNPVEIAKSLRTRNGFSILHGIALWEVYTRSALSASQDRDRVFVSYADLVAAPDETTGKLVAALEAFGIEGLSVPPDVSAFVSADLHRESCGEGELEDLLDDQQLALWENLRTGRNLVEEAGKPISQRTRLILEDLELQHERRLADRSRTLRLKEATEDLKGKLSSAQDMTKTLKGRLSEQERQLASAQATSESLRKKVAETDQELARAGQEAARQQARLQELRERLRRTEGPLRADIEKLQRSLVEARSRPLKQLRRKLVSRLLYVFAESRLLFSQERRERFRNSARKRDPRRVDVASAKGFSRAEIRAPKSRESEGAITGPLIPAAIAGSTYGKQLAQVVPATPPTELARRLRASERRLEEVAAGIPALEMRPLVSVIMPTHNRAGVLEAAIASVLEQSYPDLELLVCDDGSTDDTAKIVGAMEDDRIRYLQLAKGGAAAARNAGLEHATGEIIAYLDSDNLWHPHYLANAIAAFDRNPGRSAVYANFIDYVVGNDGSTRIKSFSRPPFDQEQLLRKNYIDLNTFAHRRELYELFGGFNERLTRRQDHDLIIKYTWLRDPIQLEEIVALYQRNERLNQITSTMKDDDSCVPIIDAAIERYTRTGLPVAAASSVRRVTIVSWDLCRNHFSKAFALAEALSTVYQVKLVSFRFFDEPIFPPLKDVVPTFETAYFEGGDFPDFFDTFRQAVEAIDGDIVYAVKPRLPSLGLALLAAAKRGVPVILEINDLETVVSSPRAKDRHQTLSLTAEIAGDEDLGSPHSDTWSRIMDPIAARLPVLMTHNHALDAHFSNRCLYMRNIKDEEVYDPDLYDRSEIRRELGFAETDRIILFGGLLRKHKGIFQLVELVERLNDPRYKLLFVGSRVTPDQRKLVDRFGDRVRVLPPQDRAAMARLNLAADLVILWLDPDVPASHYQMPYKATDALAMGATILANPISDLETLADQSYIRPVPYGDWSAMEATIRSVFDYPDETERMRDASRRLFLRQFSYNAARANFALAARRALSDATESVSVARDFAKQFNAFYRARTGRLTDFLSVDGAVPDHASLRYVDAGAPGTFRLSDPGGTVVVMPTRDVRRAEASADLLLRRAGKHTTLLIAEDTTGIGFAATVNAILPRIEARYVVHVTDTTFSGFDWLKHAVVAMDSSDKAALSFASASASRGEGSIGMVRMSWLDAAYGAPRLGETGDRIEVAELAAERDELLSTTESVLVDTAACRTGDEASDAARRAAAQSIRVVDAARLDGFGIADPGGVAVVMPSIDVARARATAEYLVDLAGMPAHVIIAEDTLRQGFIRTLNEVAARLDVRYIVYLAEDAFPGEHWLRRAFETMEASGKGLLAFNCGKWRGRIAAFGMVRMSWVRGLYGGPVFFPGYNARKADNELTILARLQGAFVYAPDCVLVEIDPKKGATREPPSEDRKLFKRRFLDLFDGLADAASLASLASEYGIDWRNLKPIKRVAEADFSTGTLASE